MAVKSGVWVDAKKAIVVKLDEKDKTFKVIDSGIETRERSRTIWSVDNETQTGKRN